MARRKSREMEMGAKKHREGQQYLERRKQAATKQPGRGGWEPALPGCYTDEYFARPLPPELQRNVVFQQATFAVEEQVLFLQFTFNNLYTVLHLIAGQFDLCY